MEKNKLTQISSYEAYIGSKCDSRAKIRLCVDIKQNRASPSSFRWLLIEPSKT